MEFLCALQVSSTWRAVSRSDLLWHRLTRSIWGRTHLLRATWHDEYVYWHRTAQNFRTGRSAHATLNFFDLSDVDDPDAHTCRCITLSDRHVACGFADGAVRLFDIENLVHISTFRPPHRHRLGQFSRAVSGIVLISDSRLVFARLDGDIHVAVINGPGPAAHPRRAHSGDVVRDGALVDFTGCDRWWVGLYAGAAGRAFHIWDGLTEELVFVGGSLTDPEAVMGWHMLTEATEFVGRVRVTSQELVVACTSSRVIVFDVRNPEEILGEQEYRTGVVVTSLDVGDGVYVIVDGRGRASVRRVGTMEEVCRFNVGVRGGGVMGCMNLGCALMSAGGVIRVWGAEHGEYLYPFGERVGGLNAFVANERHVAAAGSDTTIHLWDFGA